MSDLDKFYVHTATVQTYIGEGAMGPTVAAAVTIPCYVDDTTRLVVSATGEQVAAATTIYAAPSYGVLFTVGSMVTSSAFGDPARAARVINQNNLSSGALALPDHVEVHLI